jgi:hypothetical protein
VIDYWRTVDSVDAWTPLALWLLRLPGATMAVAEEFEMRFTTGSWSGSTVSRYRRRLPLTEALLADPNPQIAAWAAAARDRLLRYIEETDAQEQRAYARFE